MSPNNLKVVFLILAHHQPEHLGRLVSALNDPRHHFFIHIDAGTDSAPFMAAIRSEHENVHFLEDTCRLGIRWAGFNIVRATLRLIEKAWAHPTVFDRFCLLSGSDYPVSPMERIRRDLASDREFIRADRKLSAEQGGSHARYVLYYHFVDSRLMHGLRLSGRFRRKSYGKIPLYHGSQWWALSRRAVGFILDFLKAHPDYTRFHRYSYCPDEVFFLSIVKSAPFADRISHDFERHDLPRDASVSGAHYIDWHRCSNAGRSPKVLDESDFERLMASGALFARKFDWGMSKGLLDKIDQYRQECR